MLSIRSPLVLEEYSNTDINDPGAVNLLKEGLCLLWIYIFYCYVFFFYIILITKYHFSVLGLLCLSFNKRNVNGVDFAQKCFANWQAGVAVITVEPADKLSFVYNFMQTRLMRQYNGKLPISLVLVSRPLVTVITAVQEDATTTLTNRNMERLGHKLTQLYLLRDNPILFLL